MLKVCARYCGSTILLKECETAEEAEEFMKHEFTIVYSDEMENKYEDEVIEPDEMFLVNEDDLPFYEQPNEYVYPVYEWDEELPF